MLETIMGHLQKVVAAMLSVGLLGAPAWAAPAPAVQLGIVVYADHARLGTGSASVGTTVFGGDKLSTEPSGSVQVRAGAARLLLASSSVATLSLDDASPTATLTAGTATFSTANSKAFVLHFASAAIRPNTDEPTGCQGICGEEHARLVAGYRRRRKPRGGRRFGLSRDSESHPRGNCGSLLARGWQARAERTAGERRYQQICLVRRRRCRRGHHIRCFRSARKSRPSLSEFVF